MAVLENYPEIHEINEKEEEKAIETAPYLAQFIKKDKDIIKSEKSLIVKANDYFNKIKSKAQENFKRVLSANTISDDDFTSAVGQLSLIAAAELGEYRGEILLLLKVLDGEKKVTDTSIL